MGLVLTPEWKCALCFKDLLLPSDRISIDGKVNKLQKRNGYRSELKGVDEKIPARTKRLYAQHVFLLEIFVGPWMILVGFTVAILCSSDYHNTCNDCKDNCANNALQRLNTKFSSVAQTTLHLGGDGLEHRL